VLADVSNSNQACQHRCGAVEGFYPHYGLFFMAGEQDRGSHSYPAADAPQETGDRTTGPRKPVLMDMVACGRQVGKEPTCGR
jgi:hypothetical protein